MPNIEVPHLSFINDQTSLHGISKALDQLQENAIQSAPWPGYAYKPQVTFAIAYTNQSILLKYYVHEKSIRGYYSSTNAPVYHDSCLEFFISFDDDGKYYNLEFNCIGTCLFGYGNAKNNRKMISEEAVNKIRRLVVIENSVNGNSNPIYWELVAEIPLEAFVHHNITRLKGRHCKVNFYKCGDELPEPHFLAWSNIIATSPDFHLPEFFGNMHFV